MIQEGGITIVSTGLESIVGRMERLTEGTTTRTRSRVKGCLSMKVGRCSKVREEGCRVSVSAKEFNADMLPHSRSLFLSRDLP